MEINEGDAKITPEPLKAPVNSSVSERMKISESTVRKEINVNLVSSQGTECRFWVGLTKAGKITPKELLELGDIGAIFSLVASEGLAEAGPIMLSDSQEDEARFIYLLPDSYIGNSKSGWLEGLVKTIESWSPQGVGFYFSPKLLGIKESGLLLKCVLKKMILLRDERDFYLLLEQRNLNSLLNTALSLRKELFAENIDLSVFH